LSEFEQALERLDSDTAAVQKAAATVAGASKRLAAAAKAGDGAAIDRAFGDCGRAVDALQAQLNNTRSGWNFDWRGHIESERFKRELLEAASEAGLIIHEQDGRIFSYPVLVRILTGGDLGTVSVDRKRMRTIRPSHLVALLKTLRDRPPKAKNEEFLKSLYAAYGWATQRDDGSTPWGPVAELVDLYEILTLFPGQTRDYSRQEFTRDLYLLDRSDIRATRDGARFELSASTGTKGSRSRFLTIVGEDGEEKAYYGISFARPTRP
jgi:hypothetical protein